MTRVKCPRCEFINAEGQSHCARCKTPLPKVVVSGAARPNPPQAPPRSEEFVFRPGQMVASRYSVISMIGRGGMGCIYRVHDNVLKEDVALKTLLPQFVRDKMVVERFFNEARIARSLSHPNVVRVHDIGMTGNLIYISMELIKGKSLRTMLEELGPGQRMSAKTALHVIDELCAALEYAHGHTVHRDIKPENVMVCEDGTVKLMDFGISKLMDTKGLTGTSVVMGTPFYMSPEQLRNSANVDARADIYSVGVVLYEILTGNMPTGVPKPASQLTREVPPALDPIVAKCVDPDPAQRYQSATELRMALRPILGIVESGYLPPLPGSRKPVKKPSQGRGRQAVGLVLIALVALVAATGVYGIMKSGTTSAIPSKLTGPRTAAGNANAAPTGFGEIEAMIDKAKSRLPSDVEKNEDTRAVLDFANTQWDRARKEAARKDSQAVTSARQALQAYIALLMWDPEMVFIVPGDVTIREGEATSTVSVDGFFIDASEVTNGQYLKFCTTVPQGWRQPGGDLGAPPPDLPVVGVSFYDAMAYAAWARKRLPTETQWARAAYGERNASEHYPWGDEWKPGACNSGSDNDGSIGPAPVETFKEDRTWSGCYDMAGNVSEWTRSVYRELPYNPADGREDPAAPDFGVELVVRGGNFRDEQRTPLNARFHIAYETVFDMLGFRCVRELPATPDDVPDR